MPVIRQKMYARTVASDRLWPLHSVKRMYVNKHLSLYVERSSFMLKYISYFTTLIVAFCYRQLFGYNFRLVLAVTAHSLQWKLVRWLSHARNLIPTGNMPGFSESMEDVRAKQFIKNTIMLYRSLNIRDSNLLMKFSNP